MTRATSVMDDCINKLKIRAQRKMSQNEKKGHGGKHTHPKKWSGARRPAGPATTALFHDFFSPKCYCRAFYVVLEKRHGAGKKGMALREKGHGAAPC